MNKAAIRKIIENQKKFIKQITLTLKFLELYKGNPDFSDLLFSKDIIEHYQMDFTNPEFMAEAFDELAYDIIYKEKKFCFISCGIFITLYFKQKGKKEATTEEIFTFAESFNRENWEI